MAVLTSGSADACPSVYYSVVGRGEELCQHIHLLSQLVWRVELLGEERCTCDRRGA